MKKILSFFALILITIAGVMVGCTSDRYANLSIAFDVVTESTYSGDIEPTKKKINGEEKDYLEIYYAEAVQIVATVSGMSDINTSINYSASDPEAITITNSYNAKEGTYATITGVKPTEGDSYYVLRIASAETSTKYKELYIKVVLPVDSISIPNGLALTKIHSLNLNDYLTYSVNKSVYGDIKYTTNQKGVTYQIVSYQGVDGTNLIDSGFVTIDSETGLLEVNETAENYAGTLKVRAVSDYTQVVTEEEIICETTISVFEDIILDDISYTSNQASFKYPLGVDEFNKNTINLYSNIDQKYLADDKGTVDPTDDVYGEFYNETLAVRVATSQAVKISCVVLDEGDKNVVYVQDGASSLENNPGGNLVAQNQNFVIRTRGVTGTAKVNIVVTYEGTVNPISYTFEETKLDVTASGVPTNIIMTQDNQDIVVGENLTIYDEYKNSATTSDWGSKFSLRPITGATAGILDSNKKVQLRIKYALDGTFGEKDFKLYGYNDEGSIQILNPYVVYDPIDGVTIIDSYFLFDLSKPKNDIFYIKAVNVSNAEFDFEFKTVLENVIQLKNNDVVDTKILEKTFNYTIQTKYGVKEMITMDANGNIVDSKHRVSDEYKYLTVKKYEGVDATSVDGSLASLFVNLNADITGLKVEVANDTIVELIPVGDVAPNFTYEGYDMVQIAAYSIVGLTRGSTEITFTAKNGYSTTINVKVVEQPVGLTISIDDAYNNQVITKKENNEFGRLHKVYAKVNGSFNVYTNLESGASGVISYEYESSNNTVAIVNDLGKLTTLAEGKTTISVVATYYKFVLVDGYLQWEKASDMLEQFELNVFIPSTNVTLNNYYVTVYDSNSLGYEYQDNSIFEVSVLVSPITATIYGDESKITYSFSGNQNGTIAQVPGYTNRFQATFSDPNLEREVIYIIVNVEEFGTNIPLMCTVTVLRAVQIEEIKANIEDYADEEETIYFLSLYQGESFDLDLIYKPTNAFVTDLVPLFFEYDAGSVGAFLETNDIVSLTGRRLTASRTSSGYIYLRIFARDSMNSPTTGETYITILLQVTDGTVDNPYQIKTVQQLQEIALAPTKHYVLGRDINIGSVSNWRPIQNFSGTLNGYNVNIKGGTYFSITNLNITSTTLENVGLFSEITTEIEEVIAPGGEPNYIKKTKGAVVNLRLTVHTILLNQTITPVNPTVNVGAIAGRSEGLIMNCAVEIQNFKVNILNRDVNVGGVVGLNEGVIYNFANHRGFATKDFVDAGYTSTEHKLDDILSEFDDYKLTPTRKGSAALLIKESISSNPIKGTLTVNDNNNKAYVGGIAGSNFGLINGIYGIFNYIEENRDVNLGGDVNYAVTYQSQGTDALININHGDVSQVGVITNPYSSVGGIAGCSVGKIYNCSADGYITGLNNVGGIVGKMENVVDSDPSQVKNALASVKINATNNVGGIVGLADGSVGDSAIELELVRVETYQNSLRVTDETLINALDNVGGVAGFIQKTKITYAYAASFIDADTTGYSTYGDIYIREDSPSSGVGGIVGVVSTNSEVKGVYSTLRISVPEATTDCVVGPIAGKNAAIISDCYYIGTLNLNANSKDGLVGDGNVVTGAYYYQAKYDGGDVKEGGLSDVNNTTKYKYDGTGIKWITNANYDDLFTTNYTLYNEIISSSTYYCPVLVYQPALGIYRPFIKIVPSAINVGVNVDDSSYDNDVTVNIGGVDQPNPNYQTATMGVSNKFAGYKNNADKWLLVIEYSTQDETENIYEISDVMKATATPDFLNGVNILVTSSDELTLEITSDGKFIVKRPGTITLTFRAKLNYTAVCEVTVNVINSFDELKIYSDISKSKDMLISNTTRADAYKVRKDVSFYPLPTFVDDGVELEDITTYTLDYKITTVSGDDGLTYTDGTFISHAVGVYKVEPVVKYFGTYLGETITFSIANPNWVFYVSIFEGAESIILGTNEKVEIAGYSVKEITVQIKTDNETDKIGKITFTDSNGTVFTANKEGDEYTFTYRAAAGTDLPEDDDHYVPFEMKINSGTWEDGIITATIVLSVEEEYRDTHTIQDFILNISPESEPTLVATLPVSLVPQEINALSAVHYQYSEIVKGNDTQSYSFSANPSNAVIPGNIGLFEIDLFPYYSGIESISISSSIDDSGSKLTFAQLVRVTSTDVDGKNYFILSPKTTFLPDNSGIYLDKQSYIDSDLAKIHVEDVAGVKKYRIVDPLNPTIDIPRSRLEYLFDDGYTENARGTGTAKLYVQTIAPSTLQDATSFECYITIKYYGLNESTGELELKTRRYTHTLYIETLPRVYLNVKDREANVIAYTNEKTNGSTELGHDFVEFEASVSTGATIDALEISDIKNSNGESKVSINFSDYATIRNNKLYLNTSDSSKVAVGDIIVVTAQVTTTVETFVSVQTASCEITVADVVVKGVSVQGLNADNNMFLTVSTSKQLKVSLQAYGTKQAVSGDNAVFGAEQIMSNSLAKNGDAILYWQTQNGGNYINIDSSDVSARLPFYVAKNGFDYGGDYNIASIVITGKTGSGVANLRFFAPYYYKEGKICFYDQTIEGGYEPKQIFECKKDFTVVVRVDSNDDNPTPIYSVGDLNSMNSGGNYILMSDIEIDSHTPINKDFATFDGNNHVITIKAFSYNPNLQTSTGAESINLGLFDTISASSIVKNVIVALPNNKTNEAKLQLENYSIINIGGIAGVNNGVVYNCDVITTDVFNNADPATGIIRKNNYSKGNFSYTLNAITAPVINGNETQANIGLFVGVNTGNITNSRVGRNEVTVVSTYDSTVASTSLLKNVAPITIMKVEGKANVSGFVAQNTGTISTSYANNIQIQSVRAGKSKDVKTAGFVVDNRGYVYGSYAAGWEEADEEIDSFLSGTKTYVLNGNIFEANDERFSATRKLGGGIFSNGSVAGFVYTNNGYVEDCYSNLNISGNVLFACNKEEILATPDYDVVGNLFAGGFVLENEANAIIKTSYSNSKTDVTKITHGIFLGVDAVSNVQNDGTIDGSYFLVEGSEASIINYSNQPANPLSDASNIDVGGADPGLPAADANEFVQTTSFASFSFSPYEYNDLGGKNSSGVWAIKKYASGFGYPELISANNIATSVRVINVAQTNVDMNVYYYNYVEGYEKGSENNPQIITTASEYNNIFTDVINASSLLNENISVKFTDNIRLVKNIDFTNVVLSSTAVEYTSLVDSLSVFDGNYMALTNIVLSDESAGNFAFGLFRTLNKVGFKCLTISISDVSAANAIAVGGLAGIIVNSDINNINLVASNLGVSVSGVAGRVLGNNFVGGLAGIVVASEKDVPHKIQNVNSNLSVLAGHPGEGETVMTLKPNVIWNKIIPPSQIEGNVSTNNNLRLEYLPTNYYYAGGIAGAVDLKQASIDGALESVSDKNFSGIVVGEVVVSTPITANFGATPSIQGQYIGGIAGFIGKETLLEDAGFIVGDEDLSNMTSYLVAGGIVGQNYGVVSQCYVQYNSNTQKEADDDLVEYIGGETNVSWYKKDLYQGSPVYVGGIVGVNIGSSADTGHIKDCYNRVNVINEKAKAIGGIVGATHIGSITNVYTTATVIGDLTDPTSSIGAVIGRVLTDSETVFCTVTGAQATAYRVNLEGIVALNAWDTSEFDKLYDYVYDDDHEIVAQIGALYGANTNEKLIYIDVYGSTIFVQDYIIRDYTNPYILDQSYNIKDIPNEDKIQLFLGTDGKENLNDLSMFYEYLHPAELLKDEFVIDANEFRALLSTTVTEGVSSLRTTFFSQDSWKREIWSYNDEYILPLLEYGFISDVVRIYTADDFVRELTRATVSNKLYIIMNDIDFKDYGAGTGNNFQINSFSGMLYGNTISYQEGTDTYTRKPILFNLNYDENNLALFATAVNASFSNFTIVVNSYDVESPSATTNKASALVARATNTNLNNINVYGSLVSTINHYAEGGEREGAIITQGKSTLYGDTKPTYKKFLRLFDAPNAKEVIYEHSGTRFVKTAGGLEGEIYDPILVNTLSEVETNTLFFGGLVADGNSITIASSSFNIGIEADLGTNVVTGNNSIYIGGLAGNLSGSIINSSVIADKITVLGKTLTPYVGTYVGGLVGSVQGRMTNTRVMASGAKFIITVGDASNKMKSTNTGNYIGGVGGNVSSYLTSNNATVGGVETVRAENVYIRAFIDGKIYAGGIAGSNGYASADIRCLFNTNEEHIKVLAGVNSEIYVGGIFGNNTATVIKQVYTNINISIQNQDLDGDSSLLYIGGVIGRTIGGLSITDAAIDSNQIKIFGRPVIIVGAGGVIGYVNEGSNTAVVTLKNVVTLVDILIESTTSITGYDPLRSLAVGGAVGSVPKLTAESLKVLGDITIRESTGIELLHDPLNVNKYFFYIGGLAGRCDYEFTQGRDPFSTVVATTIRNYDVAHQADAKIGAIFGKGPVVIASNGDLVYFNEGISLAADYGNNANMNYGNNVPQIVDATEQSLASLIALPFRITKAGETYENHTRTFLYDEYFLTLQETTYYSKFKTEYLSSWYSDASKFANLEAMNNTYGAFSCLEFNEGTKLNPVEISQTDAQFTSLTPVVLQDILEDNKYYLLTSNIAIANTCNTTKTGWVLSCQGYGIYSRKSTSVSDADYYCKIDSNYYDLTKPAFNKITVDSAISGLITYGNYTTAFTSAGTLTGTIARVNEGIVFSCGVKGEIHNNNTIGAGDSLRAAVGGLIGENLGTISDCFSMVEIYANTDKAYVGGIAGINGTDANKGQITNSFFTGSAYVALELGQIAGGIAANSRYGFISNTYSIANVMPTGGATTDNRKELYAIASTGSYIGVENFRFFKTYYDQNAYIGSNVGTHIPIKPNMSGYGLPINTGKLEGTEIVKLLPGHWVSSNENWRNTYKASSKYGGEEVKLTSSWFNHGYAVKQFKNILVSEENISKFLDLFYTGNGKSKTVGGTYTNTFMDKPFIIKHAGLLEIFVLNDASSLADTSFYIVNNDLYFDYYKGNTYWSESWDRRSIRFNGDFNGQGFTMYNMYSDYGLFRALGSSAYVYNFAMENCYSQTGLVAGYVAGGNTTKIEDITIKGTNYVYNNNLNHFSTNIVLDPIFNTGGEDIFSYKNLAAGADGTIYVITQPVKKISIGEEEKDVKTMGETAGGLFGVIERGTVTGINFAPASTLYVWATGYAGGVVGYVKGGTITDVNFAYEPTGAKYNVYASGITTNDILTGGGYAGGIAGYVCTSVEVIIRNITVPVNFNINGAYAIGGVVGYMGNKDLLVGGTILPNKATITNVVAETTQKVLSVPKMKLGGPDTSVVSLTSFEKHYIGGIAGILESLSTGEIAVSQSVARTLYATGPGTGLLGSVTDKIETEGYTLHLGGLAGEVRAAAIINCTTGGEMETTTLSDIESSIENIHIEYDDATICLGGAVGKLVRGTIQVNNDACQDVNNNGISCSAGKVYAGGIVGYMQNGNIFGDDKDTANKGDDIYVKNKKAVTVDKIIGIDDKQYVSKGYAGGIVGYLEANLANSQADVLIKCAKNEGGVKSAINAIGGIVGYISSTGSTKQLTIENCVVESADPTDPRIQLGDNADLGVAGTINDSITQYIGGVVGKIHTKARGKNIIKDITSNCDVYGEIAGGIVGWAEAATIQDVVNKGTITGICTTNSTREEIGVDLYTAVGGIVGKAISVDFVTVESSVASGTATAIGDGRYRNETGDDLGYATVYVGGLVGHFNSSVFKGSKAANNGQVKSQNALLNEGYAGGLIGYVAGGSTLFDSTSGNSNSGSVVTDYIGGGIIGCIGSVNGSAQLKYVSNTGSVTGGVSSEECSVGGIVGRVSVSLSIATGVSNGGYVTGGYATGGIVGTLELGTVSAASNSGTIDGIQNVGGIVGVNKAKVNAEKGSVINSGAVLALDATYTAKVGGIVGYNMSASGVDGKNSSSYIMNNGIVVASYTIFNENDIGSVGGVIGFNEATLNVDYLYNAKTEADTSKLSYKTKNGTTQNLLRATVMTIHDITESPYERKPFQYVGGILGYTAAKTELKECFNEYGSVVGYDLTAVSGTYIAGGLVGANSAKLVVGSDSGQMLIKGANIDGRYVGGILGYAYGETTVNGISMTPKFTGVDTSAPYVGGVIGYVDDVKVKIGETSAVNLSSGASLVTISGQNVGAIVGYSISEQAMTIGTTAAANISVSGFTINGRETAGGLVGYAVNAVINGEATTVCPDPTYPDKVLISNGQTFDIDVKVTPNDNGHGYAGGVVGYLEKGTINTIINAGEITNGTTGTSGTRQAIAIGGIAGAIGNADEGRSANVTNCQNTGPIGSATSCARYNGGLVGLVKSGRVNSQGTTTGYIVSNNAAVRSTSVNVTTTETVYAGGIVGYMASNEIIGGATTVIQNEGTVDISPQTNYLAYAGGIVGGMKIGRIGDAASYAINLAQVGSSNVPTAAGGIVGIIENATEAGVAAVYGKCGETGTVPVITGNRQAGGIVGAINITTSSGTANINGENYATIKNSTNENAYAGGIVGWANSNDSEITIGSDTINNGSIEPATATNETCAAGGIIGFGNNIKFTSAKEYANTGKVGTSTSTSVRYVGGLIGVLVGELSIVYGGNNGELFAQASGSVGGLVGATLSSFASGTYSAPLQIGNLNSKNHGAINVGSGTTYAGGIVGRVDTSNIVTVTGKNEGVAISATNAGGIVGYYKTTGDGGTAIHTYGNTGSVTGGYAGGIVGYIYSDSEIKIKNGAENNIANGSDGAFASVTGNITDTNTKKYGVGGLIGYAKMGPSTNYIFAGTFISKANVTTSSVYTSVGGIVGRLYSGTVTSVTNKGSITSSTSESKIGGIVGSSTVDGIISQATNEGAVTGSVSSSGQIYTGGIIGYAMGDINAVVGKVENLGAVTGVKFAGGIAGVLEGASVGVSNAAQIINNGVVETTSSKSDNSYAGGIVGYATTGGSGGIIIGTNQNNVIAGKGSGSYTVSGGIIGYHKGAQSVYGTVSGSIGDGNNLYAGAVVGWATEALTISGSVRIQGSVTSNNSAGGVVGYVQGALTLEGTVNSKASVTATTYAGGIAGNSTSISIKEEPNIAEGTIKGGTSAGGVVGTTNGSDISFDSNVTLKVGNQVTIEASTSSGYAGGISGKFSGNFDGGSNNFKFDNTLKAKNLGGMFGTIDPTSAKTIQKFSLQSSTISLATTPESYGGVAAYAKNATLTLITNNSSIMTSFPTKYYGGIIGKTEGTVTLNRCSNTAVILGSSAQHSGGMVAYNSGTLGINGCTNSGDVTAYEYAGGLLGYAYSTTSFGQSNSAYCSNSSIVTGEKAGGFVGKARVSLEIEGGSSSNKVRNAGSVAAVKKSGNTYAGGFVGWAESWLEFSQAQNTAAVGATNDSNLAYAGGFVGYVQGSLSIFTSSNGTTVNATTTILGDMNSTNHAYAGGFAGKADGSASLGSSSEYISNSATVTANVNYEFTQYFESSYPTASDWDSSWTESFKNLNAGLRSVHWGGSPPGTTTNNVKIKKRAYCGGIIGYFDGTLSSTYRYMESVGKVQGSRLFYLSGMGYSTDGGGWFLWDWNYGWAAVGVIDYNGVYCGYGAGKFNSVPKCGGTNIKKINTSSISNVERSGEMSGDTIWENRSEDLGRAQTIINNFIYSGGFLCAEGDYIEPHFKGSKFGGVGGGCFKDYWVGGDVDEDRACIGAFICSIAEAMYDMYQS